MKKLFLKILLVYSIGWFVILPVYARAGGGNGGDSGSSSGNGYSYYEYHDYSNGSSSSHIDSIILVGVGGFLLFGGIMNAFNKNKQNVVPTHMWEKEMCIRDSIYTMNKPDIAKAIFNNIPTVLKELTHE